ncbi:hypothetical protein [Microaceticoccus formicicus]|uniref:hypothetical protein n=1 Tax=Microaceticoccus formicicus TaxID=3118105 RepID=UPI003CD02818|nr:hypothetical protein VZL98_08255 [Peptoniphilaceae bacterium AMB_02]
MPNDSIFYRLHLTRELSATLTEGEIYKEEFEEFYLYILNSSLTTSKLTTNLTRLYNSSGEIYKEEFEEFYLYI